TQAAGAQQQRARIEQLALAGPTDLGKDEVAGVTGDLVGGEGAVLGHVFQWTIPRAPAPIFLYWETHGNRIPRRRAGDLPLQQGPDREEDMARRHLELPRRPPVRGHGVRLLDPQRHGLEGLA